MLASLPRVPSWWRRLKKQWLRCRNRATQTSIGSVLKTTTESRIAFTHCRERFLLFGLESRPVLDPHFPTAKYLDLTRWLESANGGGFEWGTGTEENVRQKQKTSAPSRDGTAHPLVFDPTNINICLFQQFSLFEEWWCQVESLHKCGFSARVLMSAADRAIIDRTVGLQDPAPVALLMEKIWSYVAMNHGPQSVLSLPQLRPSLQAPNAVRSFYYDLAEEDRKGGWASAMKSALGKMDYHIPTAACLASLASWAFVPPECLTVLDDDAVKCAAYQYAHRVCLSCAVVDSTVCRFRAKQGPKKLPCPCFWTYSPNGCSSFGGMREEPHLGVTLKRSLLSVQGRRQIAASTRAHARAAAPGAWRSCVENQGVRTALWSFIAFPCSLQYLQLFASSMFQNAYGLWPSLPPMHGAGQIRACPRPKHPKEIPASAVELLQASRSGVSDLKPHINAKFENTSPGTVCLCYRN